MTHKLFWAIVVFIAALLVTIALGFVFGYDHQAITLPLFLTGIIFWASFAAVAAFVGSFLKGRKDRK
jgi:ABC-type transport system involved in multi-copper enzyme maturation permease subunit